MRIVIADDSGLMRERLQQMLSPIEQLEIVGSFANGIETLEALRTLKPDLAILDLNMPGLNGLQVLSEICKEGKNLKFIILTLYASRYYQKLAIHSGADYFFSKVDDFETVGLLVREMIANDGISNKLIN